LLTHATTTVWEIPGGVLTEVKTVPNIARPCKNYAVVLSVERDRAAISCAVEASLPGCWMRGVLAKFERKSSGESYGAWITSIFKSLQTGTLTSAQKRGVQTFRTTVESVVSLLARTSSAARPRCMSSQLVMSTGKAVPSLLLCVHLSPVLCPRGRRCSVFRKNSGTHSGGRISSSVMLRNSSREKPYAFTAASLTSRKASVLQS
jgi:hypothetical protein